MKAVPVNARQFAAAQPTPHAQGTHSIRVLGVPLFGFAPYTRDIFYVESETGDATQWLKVRSWLWPGLLTNASKIIRLCGPTSEPCWTPQGGAGSAGRSSNLKLSRAGDRGCIGSLPATGARRLTAGAMGAPIASPLASCRCLV